MENCLTKKMIFYNFLKYIFFFFLFIILSFAEVNGLRPFAFGMLFALVWCNQKIFIVAPLYLVSSLLVEFSVQNLLCAGCTISVFVLFFALHYKLKKPLNKIFVGLYAFLSQVVYIYFNSYSLDAFLNAGCYLVVGMVCMYAYLLFMQSLLLRGLRRKYSVDEMICAGVLFLALGAGISSLPISYLSKGLFVLLVLVLSFVLSFNASISLSVLLGLGSLFALGDYGMFLFLTLLSLTLSLAKTSHPIFSILIVFVVDFFTNLYFFDYFNLFDFLPTAISCLVFLILCFKILKKLKIFVIGENEDFSARHFINKSKMKLSKTLLNTSNLFLSMQNTFVSMSKSKLSPSQAVFVVANESKKQICSSCPKFSLCLKQNDINKDLQTLSSIALSRGHLGIFDIPANLGANCLQSKLFVQKIDSISKDYKNFCVVENSMDSSRMILANQFFAVSQILKSLSQSSSTKIVFDPKKEETLKEELLLAKIVCSEVLINFCEGKLCDITLVIKHDNLDIKKIEKISSKVLGTSLETKLVEDSSKSGFSVVVLISKIFFDVVFGCSGALKHGSKISGDSHSALRICEDKIMMALCDGMGSGKDANDISTLALDLIEKFYKAGFDTNLILENVNSILSLREEENFGALDVCVFDLKLCACDILKLGAPVGFLKQKDITSVIDAGALPLGILNEVKPSIKSFALNDGDMVVLVTDGILDACDGIEDLKIKINNFQSKNPQQLADMILDFCMQKCKNMAPDDMTVLVGKIWKKI